MLSETQIDVLKNEVHAAFQGLVEAAMSLEVEPYLAFFDEHRFTALKENGTVVHSLDEFAEAYRHQIPMIKAYQSLEFDHVKLTVINSTTVILVNEYTATVLLSNDEEVTASGAGTQVWALTAGSWKLVSVSSSSQP